MDLNQLLYHHQIAVMNALAAQKSDRFVHGFDMVQYYAKRINAYRAGKGLSAGFVNWAAHSPDAAQASDRDFSRPLPASLLPTLVPNSMIAHNGIDKAPIGFRPPATAPPLIGDTPQMTPSSPSEAQPIRNILKHHSYIDNSRAIVAPTSLLGEQLEEWENEGGAQFIRPRLPALSPKKRRATVMVERNVHDVRAQALRDLINLRNIMDPSNDD